MTTPDCQTCVFWTRMSAPDVLRCAVYPSGDVALCPHWEPRQYSVLDRIAELLAAGSVVVLLGPPAQLSVDGVWPAARRCAEYSGLKCSSRSSTLLTFEGAGVLVPLPASCVEDAFRRLRGRRDRAVACSSEQLYLLIRDNAQFQWLCATQNLELLGTVEVI